MKVICVVGARPNFMKVAPVHAALRAAGHSSILVHTGQHYDEQMSKVFFEDLQMPRPEVNLEVGSGSHAVQTARIMERFEPVVLEHRPDWVLVAGDVNSTIACALVAVKLGVKVAHLEAGLRSGDRSMPEEINRILTDSISDLLLTPSPDADENLLREGVARERIAFVGNAMIDSLITHLPRARATKIVERLGLAPRGYIVATLHRPSNVDEPGALERSLSILAEAAERLAVVFPVHPRTRARLDSGPLAAVCAQAKGLRLLPPLGYLEFLGLMADAKVVLTDSGGIQEETTALGVPCLTMRENTERPITVSEGTNSIVGTDRKKILALLEALDTVRSNPISIPARWDGATCARVVLALEPRR